MTAQLLEPRLVEPSKGHGELIAVVNVDESEVDRQMRICNACRYCEGFCAVFRQ